MPAYDPKFKPGDKVVGYPDGTPWPCGKASSGKEYEIESVDATNESVRIVDSVGTHPAREWILAPVPEPEVPEPPFKPGDRVRRLDGYNDEVVVGGEYIIKSIADDGFFALVGVDNSDTSDRHPFSPEAFEKIVEQEPEPDGDVRWNVKTIARSFGKPTAMTTEDVRAFRDELTDRLDAEDRRRRSPYALKDVKIGPPTDGSPTGFVMQGNMIDTTSAPSVAEVDSWTKVGMTPGVTLSFGPAVSFTEAPQDDDDFDAYAEDPAERGWRTVPSNTSASPTVVYDLLTALGLDVRIQARPTAAE